MRHLAVVASLCTLRAPWQEPCFDSDQRELRELDAGVERLFLKCFPAKTAQGGLEYYVTSVQAIIHMVQCDLHCVQVLVIDRPEVAVQTPVQLWITAMQIENELCGLPDFPVEFPSSIHEDHVRLVCSPPLPG